ncbi:unnamed protein product [Darwinula stevensoni]|uniref:Kringle domain-containing protein n=1 Tax=Darwinula stevensoni TaxID=69355 RepID=A0A7R9ACY9_9CRUS|nr:unnamed protein product [Darwinula stevensoni]CAG0900276.1 unnamed protein product [Darwinula stevensoni]
MGLRTDFSGEVHDVNNLGVLFQVPVECKLTQKGAEYVGKRNENLSGHLCLPWLAVPLTIQYRTWFRRLPAFSDKVDKKHDYCRNPGGRPGGPWCYDGVHRENQEIGWNYCDVPFCPQERETNENHETKATYPDCRITKMGKEYMGTIRTSETGKKCMRWTDFEDLTEYPIFMMKALPLSSDTLRWNPFKDLFINRNPDAHVNFCRNPGWGDRPWCFVSKYPVIEWEYCDVHFCKNLAPFECLLTSLGGEYIGKKNVSRSGDPCLPWLNSNMMYSNRAGAAGENAYPQCLLTENGMEYIGTMTKTATGKDCLFWDEHPAFISQKGGAGLLPRDNEELTEVVVSYLMIFPDSNPPFHRNYCRNLDLKRKPWCYVDYTTMTWEYCDIPFCDDTTPPECKVTELGWEYVGQRNHTSGGLPCLPWAAANRTQLSFNETGNPFLDNAVAEGHNFCRFVKGFVPGFSQGPFCIHALEFELGSYDNGNVDACDIPFCPMKFRPIMDVLRAIDAEEREPSNQYRPRIYLNNGNPIEFYDEDQFIVRFRLSKDPVMELVRLLQVVLSRQTLRSQAITVPQQPKNDAERRYNRRRSFARRTIERTFGIMKGRIRCLFIPLRVKLDTAYAIIVSAAIS